MSLFNTALEAHRQGNLHEALRLYTEVLAEKPDHADALALRGVTLGSFERHEEAIESIEQALRLDPDAALFHFYLGNALSGRNWDRAVISYQKAAALQPNYAPNFFFLGVALSRCDRHKEALAAYRQAYELDPMALEALNNCALTHQILMEPEKARQTFLDVLERAGQAVDEETLLRGREEALGVFHASLALLELRMGLYRCGFARYRSRFKKTPRPFVSAPLWRGENISGKKIFVYTEQGFGDMLMLARYLPMLKARGAYVVFQAPLPLFPYLSKMEGVDSVVEIGSRVQMVDFCASLFDLPHLFETTIDTIPATIPYLPILEPTEETRIEPANGDLKIGVVWAGNPANATDNLRSIPLDVFSKIFRTPNAVFYGLNRDMKEGEAALLKENGVTDLSMKIHSFADTARLVAQMDLIVSCDSAVAHLAGGIGKKVLLLIPFDPDWRWGYKQDVSLWYASIRILRQSAREKWDDVIERACMMVREQAIDR